MTNDPNAIRGRAVLLTTLAVFAAVGVGPAEADGPGVADCSATHWVGSWAASPSDALGAFDPALQPIFSVGEQSYRIVVTPHRGGGQVRIRLTNRFRSLPLTVGHATIADRAAGAEVDAASMRPITFAGQAGVTLAPGAEILSDPIEFGATAWEPIAVSVYLPGAAPFLTEHFNGNATSYYTAPGAGDTTGDSAGAVFSLTTTAVPLVSTLDVSASGDASAVVALGDSITDGYVSANYIGIPQNPTLPDTNARYPDFLQHRLDTAGIPLTVLNAGISGNALADDGMLPVFGPSAVSRAAADVLSQSAVSDVILLEGINDLDSPAGADYDRLIATYINIITRLKAAGLRVHLGTLMPAGGSLLGSTIAPRQNPIRLRINDWIRTQHLSDTVIDFAAAVQDPADPNALDPRFAGPDKLHPNLTGYRAMADAIDISTLGGKACG
ncbi:GDSL-type esterase/lipase family protein [Nocardia sp.]|uniref:GDSL-type esterase/lipase family protein n=1 Tax=Nocardia sp. TaxID=1821 RepID=UPI002635671B|nr:GDSL-type esterase/lipase family protein [Nocardia sp.]